VSLLQVSRDTTIKNVMKKLKMRLRLVEHRENFKVNHASIQSILMNAKTMSSSTMMLTNKCGDAKGKQRLKMASNFSNQK